jgi:RNA polymerase sigma-70 factor (ECF subfamily)
MAQTTCFSLIDALRKGGGTAAWERFYKSYSGVLISFAKRQGCDEHAALDVLQETVMVLVRKLPDFVYEQSRGRFRNWLMTIAANKVREAHRRAKVDRLISMDATPEGETPLADRLADNRADVTDELERDWRRTLLEDAMRQILADPRTNPVSVTIFRQLTQEGMPSDEVARRHGMTENNVYQIKNRLMTRLRTLVSQMEVGSLPQSN